MSGPVSWWVAVVVSAIVLASGITACATARGSEEGPLKTAAATLCAVSTMALIAAVGYMVAAHSKSSASILALVFTPMAVIGVAHGKHLDTLTHKRTVQEDYRLVIYNYARSAQDLILFLLCVAFGGHLLNLWDA